MEPLRSLLFIPGNRDRFLAKSQELSADALAPDLESSVPTPEKAKARGMVREALPSLARGGRPIFVRVNAAESTYFWDDLNTVICESLTGIVLPQAASADEIRRLDEVITSLEHGKGMPFGHVRIIPFIESALGVLRAQEIATASSRIVALAFGSEDFTADLGVPRSPEGDEVLYARNHVAIAARAAHKLAIDAPFVNIKNLDGLVREGKAALQLGYKGKFVIHPNQIGPINDLFSPSEAEIQQAKLIVSAFERAEMEGLGTCSLDGKMIDTAIALRAQKLLRTAEALSPRHPAR